MAETNFGGSMCEHVWHSNAEGDRICRRCGRSEIGTATFGELRGASANPINAAMNVEPPQSSEARWIASVPKEMLEKELQKRQAREAMDRLRRQIQQRRDGLLELDRMIEENWCLINQIID